MATKKKAIVVLFVRAPRALVQRIDDATEQERRKYPGRRINRSDIVREALERAFPER